MFEQFVVRAFFLNLAFVEHNNLVGFLNGAEAVGNHNRSAACHEFFDGILNQFFGFAVHAAGGLVQDNDARVVNNGSHKRNQLPLPHRKRGTALHNIVVVAAWQPFNELVNAHQLRGFHDFGAANARVAQRNVVFDGIGKQKNVLQNHANLLAQESQFVFFQIVAVHQNLAFIDFIKTA